MAAYCVVCRGPVVDPRKIAAQSASISAQLRLIAHSPLPRKKTPDSAFSASSLVTAHPSPPPERCWRRGCRSNRSQAWWLMERTFPSGSSNHATWSPDGAVQIPSS